MNMGRNKRQRTSSEANASAMVESSAVASPADALLRPVAMEVAGLHARLDRMRAEMRRESIECDETDRIFEAIMSERYTMTAGARCAGCGSPTDNRLMTLEGERFCSEECFTTTSPRLSGMESRHRTVLSKAGADDPDAVAAGISVSTAGSAGQYADNVVLGARQGHGLVAERANHLVDRYLLRRDAALAGQGNARNGADRLVDGLRIQSKYCETGAKCIENCFRNGEFRYFNGDGTPMQIEVPSDKHADAVKEMARKIANGAVPGVSDPAEAGNMVRKGHFTYEQALNMAKFCTVESLAYDAVNGMVVASGAAGMTALMTLARAVWSGNDFDGALTHACKAALQVGGVSLASAVLAQQLGRTGCESALRSMTDALVKKMGSSAAAFIVNSVRSGDRIYGAAARNHLSKLLRGNVVTGVATVAVMSSVDVYRMIDGRISGGQLFKNVVKTSAGVAGGAAGFGIARMVAAWFMGGPVGGLAGTLIGVAGGLAGGALGSGAAGAVLDEFIEDDALEMFRIFKGVLAERATDFLLDEAEIDLVTREVDTLDLGDEMLKMYASGNRELQAASILDPIILDVVRERRPVRLPSNERLLERMGAIMVPCPANPE